LFLRRLTFFYNLDNENHILAEFICHLAKKLVRLLKKRSLVCYIGIWKIEKSKLFFEQSKK